MTAPSNQERERAIFAATHQASAIVIRTVAAVVAVLAIPISLYVALQVLGGGIVSASIGALGCFVALCSMRFAVLGLWPWQA